MKLQNKDIENILSLYNIKCKVKNTDYYIDYCDAQKQRYKIIFRVDLSNQKKYIIKLVKELEHTNHLIEEQSIFSEHLRRNDIKVPKRYMHNNKYCNQVIISNIDLNVTVEEYVGEEVTLIDLHTAYKIGKLFGRIHRISEKDDCHINGDTLFHITEKNDVSGYEEFLSLKNDNNLDLTLYNEILDLYNKKLNSIKSRICRFKSFATQGDISINNISIKNNELFIFDFNNAGDVPLISDMILEGLLLMYNMDLADDLQEKDRHKIYDQYVRGYTEERALTNEEQNIYDHIYKTANCMWFSRINHYDNSLLKLIEKKNYNRANMMLKSMLNDLYS